MAIKLDKGQSMLLKKMMQHDDGWDILILALGQYVEHLNVDRTYGSNEFETLRDLHVKQGKVDGVKEFFDQVQQLNFND